ncbi:MAG: enoyl-CoA hydratase/isomerase family protein [Rhodospirillales bacterium CG15_BIG_FIL_POST_REV_8_21_14_020_66_15]|nr:MAG: enoyl-CoA hydratase/isomerase family protein [Rhodospirillales bacterium CG15_BIG_FIL_POST_REV_8_21_14_020_66_15]
MAIVGTALEDGVLTVTIDRPEKRNALSREVLTGLEAAFTDAAKDDDLKAAILTGVGDKSFAAGGDLRELASIRSREGAREMADNAKRALDAIRRFPVPVVAALNGDALGGGAELAVACDFRVFACHARIGFVQGRLNISTAWGGGVDLMRLVGPAVGLRLLSRSELIDGRDAVAIGLGDAAAAPDQTLGDLMTAFMTPIKSQAPQVLRAFKAMAMAARFGLPRVEMLDLETETFSGTWVHDDHWSAAEAVLGGRK